MQYLHRAWVASARSGAKPEGTSRCTIKVRRCRQSLDPSPRLRTPPNRHLTPSNPLSASLGQVLALGNQSLMDRTGQHRDAVPADLVAEVLAGGRNMQSGAPDPRLMGMHPANKPGFGSCGQVIAGVGLTNAGKPQSRSRCRVSLVKSTGEKYSHLHTIPLHIHKGCQEPQKAVSRAQSIYMRL